MKRLAVLSSALLLAGALSAQTMMAERNLGRSSINGYVWISAWSDTTHQAEYMQGFPASHFGGFITINGIWAHILDQNPTTQETIEIYIRKDKNGQPDTSAAGVIAKAVGKTKQGTSSSRAWASVKIMFKKPVVIPSTQSFWASVRTPVYKQNDYVWAAGQQRFEPNNSSRVLCGVSPRKNVNPKLAYIVKYDQQGNPGNLLTAWYFYTFYTVGLLTNRPLLSQYSMCPVARKTASSNNAYWCQANKADYTYAGMWPDMNNLEGTGRYDKLGWKVEEYNTKQGNTALAFTLLSDKLFVPPMPFPEGDWMLLPGGAPWGFSTAWTETFPMTLTNGKYETKPLDIPSQFRPLFKGFNIYAQSVYVEVDPTFKVVKTMFSNMAGMNF